ncbi:FAD binding domain-containing protein [Actinomadura rudentiformis]|uniref:Oxidoreductase n=1 Tax=Actinomadura rudentiformis TaxID=359158 RepID=A0A6H9YYM5_9ACTN|nr:FAD binding domain-containing protein [Actinomadura rudentiformis]KAB2346971.1 oxidoreductase [Actinomadura rudentiformis]
MTGLDQTLEALRAGALPRAGGTDLLARPHTPQVIADLRDVAELAGIHHLPDGSARIGATTTIAHLAADDRLLSTHPALVLAARTLATPQIRATATVGGNLLQRNRCPYLRNPAFTCHQTGGDGCPARTGWHSWAVAIDHSACIAPHPSSLAVPLLAHDARAELHPGGTIPLIDLYGDGTDPTRDHQLTSEQLLIAVHIPAPPEGERAVHQRTTPHGSTDWPLVEATARLLITSGNIASATVAIGGIARTPQRLTAVETALTGQPATTETANTAAAHATADCTPLPQTRHKTHLLHHTVLDTLRKALGDTS